jgi:predicted GTPase
MNDPSMQNFYEYLSGSGAFNIPNLHQQLWQQYQAKYGEAEDSNIPFISYKMQENTDLIKVIEQLYTRQQEHHQVLPDEVTSPAEPNVLLQSNIKIALVGRANSGRKTLAKLMQEFLGGDV